MSELTTGWGLLIVGFLAWLAVVVPAVLVLGRVVAYRDRQVPRREQ
jgi:hypothetical protein